MVAKSRTKDRELNWYSQTDFSGGINYREERAAANQVADARNVWAPNGKIEQRPGSTYVGRPVQNNAFNWGNWNLPPNMVVKFTAAGSTYTNYSGGTGVTFAGAVGDILYIGSSSADKLDCFTWAALAENTQTDCLMFIEYYNGSSWQAINYMHGINTNYGGVETGAGPLNYLCGKCPLLLSDDAAACITATGGAWAAVITSVPADNTQVAVNSQTYYWIRMRIAGSASSTTIINNKDIELPRPFGYDDGSNYYIGIDLNTFKNSSGAYISAATGVAENGYGAYVFLGQDFSTVGVNEAYSTSNGAYPRTHDIVSVPEFDLVYFSSTDISIEASTSTLLRAPNDDGTSVRDTVTVYRDAAVEDRDEYVGEEAPYSKEAVIQSSIWPTAQHMLWANGKLWAAGLEDLPYTIRWSADTQYALEGHKVWPEISVTPVYGGDSSCITALAQFSEHVMVFKERSLWRMVSVGTDPLGLSVYEPVRVDGGVGTVCARSIVNLPTGMAYAGHDGVYLFDGVRSTKVSGAIDEVWETLGSNKREFWAATHWRDKRCYLLACSTKNSVGDNNLVLVWDYANNAWWVWDGIEANGFAVHQNDSGDETVYFIQSNCAIFALRGPNDHGTATTAWFRTHRLGYEDNYAKRFRSVNVNATNKTSAVKVRLLANDRETYPEATLDFRSPVEDRYDTGKYDTAKLWSKKFGVRAAMFREDGEFAQVEVRNTTKNEKLSVSKIELGFLNKGAQ